MQDIIIMILSYIIMLCAGMSIGMDHQYLIDEYKANKHIRSRNTHIILYCILLLCFVLEFICWISRGV